MTDEGKPEKLFSVLEAIANGAMAGTIHSVVYNAIDVVICTNFNFLYVTTIVIQVCVHRFNF